MLGEEGAQLGQQARSLDQLCLRPARIDGVGEAFEENDPGPNVSRAMHLRPVQFDRSRMDLATARLHVIQRSGPAKGGHLTLRLRIEPASPAPNSPELNTTERTREVGNESRVCANAHR